MQKQSSYINSLYIQERKNLMILCCTQDTTDIAFLELFTCFLLFISKIHQNGLFFLQFKKMLSKVLNNVFEYIYIYEEKIASAKIFVLHGKSIKKM